jgi:anti-anti-sigma regulatory factor
MDLVLATLTEPGELTLEIHGTLALAGAEQLKAQFPHLATRGLTSIEVDLSRAECITSVGLSALAIVWERAQSLAIPVTFTHVPPDILKLFEVAGLRERFVPG